MAKALPTQAALKAVLRYDAETGRLYRSFGGKEREVFLATDRDGYRNGKFKGMKYQAHRLIWKMVHGFDPDTIDHINRVKSDNRIVNLRSCTIAENSRNYPKPQGSSQYRGVCWVSRDNAWSASISDGAGGKVSLGHFKNEFDAARAYDEAALLRHGEFATLNFPEADYHSRILSALQNGGGDGVR